MKRSIRKVICCTIALLCVSFLISCHKYPEDNFLSFKKPATRLGGVWKITNYTINGTDHVHDFDHYLTPYALTDCWVEFDIQKSETDGLYHFYNGNANEIPFNSHYGNGHKFRINSRSIALTSDSAFYESVWRAKHIQITQPWQVETTNWEIRELFKDKLHLRYNGADIYFSKRN